MSDLKGQNSIPETSLCTLCLYHAYWRYVEWMLVLHIKKLLCVLFFCFIFVLMVVVISFYIIFSEYIVQTK